MGTVDKPDVYIQFYDEGITDWVELRPKSKNFTIKDAGLLKIPYARVLMRTPASMPEKAERLRIFVDTTTVDYMPFYGKISGINTNPILGTTKKYIELVAYGLEKRLKHDTITWKYATEQAAHGDLWTYKSMIEDFLVLPDSGYDTNLTLDTDAGNILNGATKGCDFTRTFLIDALRRIAETIGYDGYVWIDGEDAKIKYVGLGTLASSPATTFQDPFLRKPELEESIDEVKNYILPWGGVERGYPTVPDKFTERTLAKSSPDWWEPIDGGTIIDTPSDPTDLKTTNTATSATSSTLSDTSKTWTTDEWEHFYVYVLKGKGARQLRRITTNNATQLTITPNWTTIPNGTSKYQIFRGYNPESTEEVSHLQLSRYAVQIDKLSGSAHQMRFRIDRTGVASIDMQNRYFSINFPIYVPQTVINWGSRNVQLLLTDTNDDVISFGSTMGSNLKAINNKWTLISVTTPTEPEDIHSKYTVSSWYYYGGSTTFNATAVKYLDIIVARAAATPYVIVDRLLFVGGLKIDPFQNPQYYPNYEAVYKSPASRDQTSIDSGIGVRVYHHHNRDINSFATAQDEGDAILAVLKQHVKVVTVTKKGFAWLRPNQTVTLNSGSLGISSETWRTLNLMWEWEANYPVYCTASLIEQYAKTIPVFSPHGEVISRPIWIERGAHAPSRGGGARGGGGHAGGRR